MKPRNMDELEEAIQSTVLDFRERMKADGKSAEVYVSLCGMVIDENVDDPDATIKTASQMVLTIGGPEAAHRSMVILGRVAGSLMANARRYLNGLEDVSEAGPMPESVEALLQGVYQAEAYSFAERTMRNSEGDDTTKEGESFNYRQFVEEVKRRGDRD